MKILTFLIALLISFASCEKDDNDDVIIPNSKYEIPNAFYYNGSTKTYLETDINLFVVEVNPDLLSPKEDFTLISSNRIMIVNDFSTVSSDPMIFLDSIYSFKINENTLIPTGSMAFRPKAGVDLSEIIDLLDGKAIVQEQPIYENSYRATVNNLKEVCNTPNMLYESGLVEYSMPSFLLEIVLADN
ncbi:hypothetical protein [Sphingobacterium hungaricum]